MPTGATPEEHRTMSDRMNATNQLRNTLRPQLEKGMTRKGGDLSDLLGGLWGASSARS